MTVIRTVDEKVLLAFLRSLALSDHMGDAADAADALMNLMGIDLEWDEWTEVLDWIDENYPNLPSFWKMRTE